MDTGTGTASYRGMHTPGRVFILILQLAFATVPSIETCEHNFDIAPAHIDWYSQVHVIDNQMP
eukprot:1506096-Rhodomonas_salina.1